GGERCALYHDRIDRVEHQRRREDAARFHLVEHPRGGDASFGGIEHQYATYKAFVSELVVGPGKDAAHAVEIVARGKSILGDERSAERLRAHPGCREEDFAAHNRPIHAAFAGSKAWKTRVNSLASPSFSQEAGCAGPTLHMINRRQTSPS